MPRSPLLYDASQRIEPLNAEELKFWLKIMQEHAIFIKAGLPCDRTDLINEAQSFYREFELLIGRVDKIDGNEKKFIKLVEDAECTVKDFYKYKRRLLKKALACKLGGYNYPLLLDHTAREAGYVLRLLSKMKQKKGIYRKGDQAGQTAFWLRLMADHADLIGCLLDPSERSLVATSRSFAGDFDRLYLQGNDFVSMLHAGGDVPAFKRFLKDVRVSTVELRDFKRAAQQMIAECRLLGVLPELLADHVKREADHFLMLLALMEKGVMSDCQEENYEDSQGAVSDFEDSELYAEEPAELLVVEEQMGFEVKPITAPPASKYSGKAFKAKIAAEKQAGVDEEDYTEREPADDFNPDKEIEQPDTLDKPKGEPPQTVEFFKDDEPAAEPPAPLKQPKFKGGFKWPRPLGKITE